MGKKKKKRGIQRSSWNEVKVEGLMEKRVMVYKPRKP